MIFAIALTVWTVVAALILWANHLLARSEPPPAVDDTRWLPFLPPVPPPARRDEPDTDWLEPWPTGDDDETSLRFAQIVAAQDWNERWTP